MRALQVREGVCLRAQPSWSPPERAARCARQKTQLRVGPLASTLQKGTELALIAHQASLASKAKGSSGKGAGKAAPPVLFPTLHPELALLHDVGAGLMERGSAGPHLVIAPSSTLDNWRKEMNKWCVPQPAREAGRGGAGTAGVNTRPAPPGRRSHPSPHGPLSPPFGAGAHPSASACTAARRRAGMRSRTSWGSSTVRGSTHLNPTLPALCTPHPARVRAVVVTSYSVLEKGDGVRTLNKVRVHLRSPAGGGTGRPTRGIASRLWAHPHSTPSRCLHPPSAGEVGHCRAGRGARGEERRVCQVCKHPLPRGLPPRPPDWHARPEQPDGAHLAPSARRARPLPRLCR